VLGAIVNVILPNFERCYLKSTTEMTPRQAALQLGVGLDSVYALLWSGKLPGRRVEGRWLIAAADIDSRLKAKEARRGTFSRRS